MAINFEQEIIEALKNPVTARQGIGNVLNKVQAELSGFEASKTNLNNAFSSRSGFENFQTSGMDFGNGYKATYEDREIQPGSGTKYGFYQLRNSRGDIIGETSDRTGFLNSVNNYISKDLGYGDLFRPNEGGYSRLSRIVAQYAPKAGVAYRSMEELKQAAKAGRDSVKGNYGTFINAQGKQVVADSPEQLKNFLILGAKKVSDGTTQLKPEEISMIQAAGYKGKELQASLDAYNKANPKVQGVQQTYDPVTGKTTFADGTIQQSTAPNQNIQQPMGDAIYNINGKLMSGAAAQQSGIDISKFSPVSGGVTDQVRGATTPTQNNLSMASAGQVPAGWDAQTYANFKAANPTLEPDAQDAQMMASAGGSPLDIKFKSGLNDAQKSSITNLISKNSVLNENDAKNVAYALGINDYTQFVGKTGQEAIGSSAGQPTRDTMQANVMQVAQTQPMQKATTDFITQAFESAHGRKPTAEELSRYQNKTTADALTEIQGGAPQPKTQADLDLMNQGFERILNPQSLEDLKAAGLDPSKIVKVGNKMYKPGSFSVDSSSAAMPSEFTGAKGTIKTDGLGVGGNTKYTAGVTAAANDYYGQYLEQIAPQFYADRQSYWNSVLTSSDFREKTLLNLEDKYQLDELSKNLTDIDAKIAAKNTAYSTLINDIENQPMSMARIVGEGNHVRKLQAVEINSLLAQREAIQGNYDRAEKMMTNMYNAKVADYTDNIAAMKDWYSEQKDFFTKQEQRSYDAKIKEEERNFEMYKDNLKTVQEMAMKYPMAGITLNDNFDTALEKTIPSYIQALELEYNKDKNYQFVKGENGTNYVFDPATGTVTTTNGDNNVGGNDIQSNIIKLGLKTVPIGGKQITGNSLFTDLLTKADADMRAAGLGGLQINQDYRTIEEQTKLYNELSVKGAPVAKPGTSFHEKGLAVDVTNWQEALPFLKKYGIVNGVPNDMGHFSIGEMNPEVFNDLAKLYPEIAPQLTNEQAQLKSTSDLITNTISHSGLGESVGPTKLTRVDLNPLTGAKEEFIANINQITAKSTLDALLNLKKAGGTLGALGEKEQEMLQNAAAKFKSWEIKDSTGKVVGYDISETAFKNELTNIQNLTNIALKNAGYTTQNDYALSSDILKNYGLTK